MLDNDYVRVTRDAAPCSLAHVPECADRVIVALGDIELTADGSRRAMARGDIAVFEPGQSYELPNSHSQRVVIQLNRARLQQWPDGEPSKLVETIPDRPAFSAPVIHTVKNVGDTPLRGIVIEFKPE